MLWSHISTLMHRLAQACCRTSQCSNTFISLPVSLWNNLANPVFNGVGWVSRAGPWFFIGLSCSIPTSLLLFSLTLLSIGWYCGAGVFGLIGRTSFSLNLAQLHCLPFLIIIIMGSLSRHYQRSQWCYCQSLRMAVWGR